LNPYLMKTDARFVFDTNVIISALLFKQSKPGQAFYSAIEDGKVLISLQILKEISEVLSRKKFDRYLLREEKEKFLKEITAEAILVEITEYIDSCRDVKDNKFLELAVNGNAACIISGDSDLLELNPFRDIPIVTPDEFLKLQACNIVC